MIYLLDHMLTKVPQVQAALAKHIMALCQYHKQCKNQDRVVKEINGCTYASLRL